jgi:hypothetical protein
MLFWLDDEASPEHAVLVASKEVVHLCCCYCFLLREMEAARAAKPSEDGLVLAWRSPVLDFESCSWPCHATDLEVEPLSAARVPHSGSVTSIRST